MELMSVILKNSIPFAYMAGLKVKLANGDIVEIDPVPSTIISVEYFKSRYTKHEFNMLGKSTQRTEYDIVEIIEVVEGI